MLIRIFLIFFTLLVSTESYSMSTFSRYLSARGISASGISARGKRMLKDMPYLLVVFSLLTGYTAWSLHKDMLDNLRKAETARQRENDSQQVPAGSVGVPVVSYTSSETYKSSAQELKSSRNLSLGISLGLFAAGVYAVKMINAN